MAVAWRADTNGGDAEAANITAVEPAGAAENDILIAWLYIEADNAVTAPSGWSNSFNGTTMLAECNVSGQAFRTYAYWIRRGASAPALAWTFSSAYRRIQVAAYNGALATGDPFSFGAIAVRDTTASTVFPNTSGTTTDDNELMIWTGTGFTAGGGTSCSPPTGFAEREDTATGYEQADLILAAAGATGTISGPTMTGSNGSMAVCFCGLRPAGAGGGAVSLVRGMRMTFVGVGR